MVLEQPIGPQKRLVWDSRFFFGFCGFRGIFVWGHIFFVKCVDLRPAIVYISAIENIALSHGVAFELTIYY
ncbi:MAG TPA: hypothetical protein DIU00_05035 [Phycisphaerales bacterium]|nr:hypothetical protein [Phycisphaerales bacterium]